jgi:hypothetical protein
MLSEIETKFMDDAIDFLNGDKKYLYFDDDCVARWSKNNKMIYVAGVADYKESSDFVKKLLKTLKIRKIEYKVIDSSFIIEL